MAQQVTRCLSPDREANSHGGQPQRAVFVIGDSHAGGMTGAVREAVSGKMAFARIIKGSCAWHGTCTGGDSDYAVRHYQHAITVQMDVALQPGDVVVLLRDRNEHLDSQSISWYKTNLIPFLRRHSAILVLVYDWPWLPHSYCESSPQSSRCTSTLQSTSVPAAEALAVEYPGEVYTLNLPAWLLCSSSVVGEGKCAGVVPGGNTLAYWGQKHINYAGAMYLAPFVCSQFADWGFFDSL